MGDDEVCIVFDNISEFSYCYGVDALGISSTVSLELLLSSEDDKLDLDFSTVLFTDYPTLLSTSRYFVVPSVD